VGRVGSAEHDFRPASELLGGSIYAEPLSSLIGPIERNSIILLYGAPTCKSLLEELCFTVQFGAALGGLGRPALMVDAGNCFNPYAIVRLAQEKGLDPAPFLGGLTLSRTFNPFQLASLVIEQLPVQIMSSRPGLVVLLNPEESLGADSQLSPSLERKLSNEIAASLTRVSNGNCIVGVSCSKACIFSSVMLKQATVAAAFSPSAQGMKISLVKHPFALRKNLVVRNGGP